MLDNMKDKASAAGEAVSSTAGSVMDNVTQAVATAAGFVAGTVQSVMPSSDEERTAEDIAE